MGLWFIRAMRLLITENLFGGEHHHTAEFRQRVKVDIVGVAKYAVVLLASGYVLLLEFHHIVEG